MTVYKNIAFALKLKKVAKDEIDRIVKETAEMTSIGRLLDRYPNQMSGGQQQRVAIARAIAVNPKIFLMDEPLSNLDAKLRVAMRTELKAIHVSTGATTVFVTHDQSEAMSMADRIVVMRDGSIEQIGTPEDVYARSANIFVADFIGTPPTNFMDAEVAVEGGDYALRNQHMSLKLNDKNRAIIQKYGKREVVIGIRPENILLTDSENAILHEDCLVTEPQGSHQIIAIKAGDQIMKIVAPIRPKVDPGETVHVTFDQDAIHFFDKETSQSLWE